VVFGREYWFGKRGVESAIPGATPFGANPYEKQKIGITNMKIEDFQKYIAILNKKKIQR
jgi:hypothetical protein